MIGNPASNLPAVAAAAMLVLTAHEALAQPHTACPPGNDVPQWSRQGGTHHPLIGKVWSAQSGKLTDWQEFEPVAGGLARTSDVILLGETHDNPLHHIVRARMMRLLACAQPKPTFAVFEHLRADQKPQLDEFALDMASGRAKPDAAALLAKVGWDKTGWPAASMFLPLFQAALDTRLAILPGEPARNRVRQVARNGPGALADAERDRMALNKGLSEDAMRALLDEMRGSHCGMLPEKALAPMAAAQRFRDAHIADALLAARGSGAKGILLAGSGHVRKDRGVPWYLEVRVPDLRVASVMMMEIDVAIDAPASYAPRDPSGAPAVDFIVFTPRAQREDPCAAMRARKN